MSVTPASFRQTFPALNDPDLFDDFQINAYLAVASIRLDPIRWDSLLDYGTSLFVAHYLVLSRRDDASVAAGGVPGAVQGVLTAKAVDKVSASYDANTVSLADGGFWNMTRFGIEFLQLARMIGAGGVQVGTPGFDPAGPTGFWPGFAGNC